MDGNRSIVKCHDRSFIHDVPDVADVNISYLVDHTIFIRLINLYYCDFIILRHVDIYIHSYSNSSQSLSHIVLDLIFIIMIIIIVTSKHLVSKESNKDIFKKYFGLT